MTKRGICALIGYVIDHSKRTLESFGTKERTIIPITSRNLITGRFVPSISYKYKISRHYLCKDVYFHRRLQTNSTTNDVISEYKLSVCLKRYSLGQKINVINQWDKSHLQNYSAWHFLILMTTSTRNWKVRLCDVRIPIRTKMKNEIQ